MREEKKSKELKRIEETENPRTQASLVADLRGLGVEAGMTLLVHASMSKLGWVVGGVVTVIRALQEVLTTEGTLVMPAHSTQYTDPSRWENPPIPEAWWGIFREEMPAFNPATTPTRMMGTIAENFRTWDGVLRSNHPHFSFSAWGKQAETVTADHAFGFGMGKASPLDKLYELDGHILLLGVGHINNSSLHLAEHITPHTVWHTQGAPLLVVGKREWVEFEEVEMPDALFDLEGIGADFEKETKFVKIGQIGSAESRLFRQRPCVDFALKWIERKVAGGV